MDITQRLVYLLKPFTTTSLGRFARECAKLAAGGAFDLLHNDYRTEGCVFTIPRSHTTRRMRAKFLLDTYELPERTLVKKHIPPDACVLEMGASLGVISCVINRRLTNARRHVAVEANQELLPAIETNRAQNGCHFFIEHCIISTRETAYFRPTSNSDGGQVSDRGLISLPIRDFTEIEASYELSFDTVIMDIEGAEIAFITEYEAILPRIRTIIVEFHRGVVGDDKVEEARDLLCRGGLRFVDKMLNVEVFTRQP